MSMSGNNSRQAAAKLFSEELLELCESDLLAEKGLREIIECHGNIYHNVGDYNFFGWACMNERVTEGIIQCLLGHFHAASSAIDEDGWSPLHFACCNKNMTVNIIQLLIDASPDSVRSVTNKGRMPLHLLCGTEEIDEIAAVKIFTLLVEKCPEALHHANNRCLPIHLALRNTNMTLNIVQLLIDAATDSIRSVDQGGDMPLHNLCMNEELEERAAMEILKLLIEIHPEAIRHADNDGDLPIHFAGGGSFAVYSSKLILDLSVLLVI